MLHASSPLPASLVNVFVYLKQTDNPFEPNSLLNQIKHWSLSFTQEALCETFSWYLQVLWGCSFMTRPVFTGFTSSAALSLIIKEKGFDSQWFFSLTPGILGDPVCSRGFEHWRHKHKTSFRTIWEDDVTISNVDIKTQKHASFLQKESVIEPSMTSGVWLTKANVDGMVN